MTVALLRLASLLALLLAIAHVAMVLTARASYAPDAFAAIAAMKAHVFLFGGFNRTYWDVHFGHAAFRPRRRIFRSPDPRNCRAKIA